MLMALMEQYLLTKNIAAEQMSGGIFRTASNSGLIISRLTSKSETDKIMSIMNAELNDVK